VDATGEHPVSIPAGVELFVAEGVEDIAAEGRGSVWEAEEDESHQFDGEEFVIGEEVEDLAALGGLIEVTRAGEGGVGRGIGSGEGLELEFGGAARGGGGDDGRAGMEIGERARVGEFVVEGGAEEDLFGELAEFHFQRTPSRGS
jgi:hypothetical protein